MRKVLYKKWIPGIFGKVYDGDRFLREGYLPGTNCWEPDFTHEGLFHQWANSFKEFDSGAGNYTVALIENSDGTISEVLPNNLKFIE